MATRLQAQQGDTVGIVVCCDRDDPDHTSVAVICNQRRAGKLDSSRIVPIEYYIEWRDNHAEVLDSIWHMTDLDFADMRQLTANIAIYVATRDILISSKLLPATVKAAEHTVNAWDAATWQDFDKRTHKHVDKFCRFVEKAFGKQNAKLQRQLLTS